MHTNKVGTSKIARHKRRANKDFLHSLDKKGLKKGINPISSYEGNGILQCLVPTLIYLFIF